MSLVFVFLETKFAQRYVDGLHSRAVNGKASSVTEPVAGHPYQMLATPVQQNTLNGLVLI